MESANGGTLFLDKIGEMSLEMQAMRLRFLRQKEIKPVGSDEMARRLSEEGKCQEG
jgi:transcriptional regulator with PAS, ATPase and Fis domain